MKNNQFEVGDRVSFIFYNGDSQVVARASEDYLKKSIDLKTHYSLPNTKLYAILDRVYFDYNANPFAYKVKVEGLIYEE